MAVSGKLIKDMKKQTLFLLLAGLLTISTACNKSQETQTQKSAAAGVSEVTPVSSVQQEQPVEAKVTILKFSDYQCPACKHFVPIEKKLEEEFGDDINIVYKNFPLGMHSYAQLAARSAEAARKQGKFQQYHDLVFEGQAQWSQGNAEAIFIGYARSLELDLDKFRADMNSADMNRVVMDDRREGRELGVDSTPTFFINGDKVENNPATYEGFKALVDKYMD